MPKRSATHTIKGLNSDNKSGAIKQALDLIKNLENSKAGQINPEAISAAGQSQIAGMLKALMKLGGGSGSGGGNRQDEEEERKRRQEELERLQKQIFEVEQFQEER